VSLEAGLLQQAAELASERGDWASAQRYFQELAALQPRDAAARLGLAAARREAGDAAGATEMLDQALTLEPERAEVLRAVARDSEAAQRPAEALGFWRLVRAAAPDDAEAADRVQALEAALPPVLDAGLTHRLVLARRAAARDAEVATAHRRAVASHAPQLAELAAEAPSLHRLLLDEAKPWLLGRDAAGLPLPPPAMQGQGPLLPQAPLLLAYSQAGLSAPAESVLAALPADIPALAAPLRRELELRRLALEQAADEPALALLPELRADDAADPAGDYFAAAAAWLRFRLRRGLAQGGEPPLPEPALWRLLALESDLLRGLAQRRVLPPLLETPVIFDDGGVFYEATDLCIRQNRPAAGVALARIGVDYFQRRDSSFKSHEIALKLGVLLEQAGDPAAALQPLLRVMAEAAESGLLLAGLLQALSVLPERDGTAALAPVLRGRGAEALSDTLALLLHRAGSGGDPLQRRGIAVLTEALSGSAGGITLPSIALEQPALFGHLLRVGVAALPGGAGLAKAARQVAALASGFADVEATGQHLADLLQAGDRDGIEAIAAYLTRRHGTGLLQGRDGIVAVLGSGNVGDTLLYLAGFAAFARASGQPVMVLHRQGRTALTEFFGDVPNLRFAPIPDRLELPASLTVNRLAPGNVSLFYENAWYRGHELGRIANRQAADNFLWDKTVAVLLSGAPLLPERIEVERPRATPPAAWTEAARQRFASLGLRPGRTVFLSPLANTLFSLTPSRFNHFQEMWREAISLFRARGFDVAMNATNNGATESLFAEMAVPELDLDLRELPGFVAEGGYFAGVRSGLNDLLAICGLQGVQSRTIYMRGAEHCIGLADFGMSEVVADFNQHTPRDLAASLFADWLAAPR
jgi:hypothetical protein